jgi:hypothetical protein
MLKTLSLVLVGLMAGLGIAFWLQPSSEPSVEAEAAGAPDPIARAGTDDARIAEERLAALEQTFASEIDQRVALEARVAELSAELEALAQRPARGPRGSENAGNGLDPEARALIDNLERGALAEADERQQRAVQRLIAAGFPPDRAEWINRRTQELRMQTMQAQYEARREGRPPPADVEAITLRTELGDQDYERFLTAQGRPTSVNIMGVLASSPAERAGLQQGDNIVSYDGKRVFDIQELNELTLGGTSGESVVLDVRRNGQNLQIVLPRGPIGVWGGGPGVRAVPPFVQR